jgi:hypothetical protein
MRKAREKKSGAMKLLEKLSGGPLTLGRAIESVRKSEELSQNECAKKLGASDLSSLHVRSGSVCSQRVPSPSMTRNTPENPSSLVRRERASLQTLLSRAPAP